METIRANVQENVGYEVSSFAIKAGFVMAGLIGVWGITCLIGGFAAVGPVALVKSLFVAMAI